MLNCFNQLISSSYSHFFTHHDQTNKVDPIPEGMSVLYKVHDVRPSLQRDDQEDGHPGKPNIVKGDGTMERICWSRGALCVILKEVSIKWL